MRQQIPYARVALAARRAPEPLQRRIVHRRVRQHALAVREPLRTVLAAVRLLAGVLALVDAHLAARPEAFRAVAAAEGQLAGVHAAVRPQRARRVEGLAAIGARVRRPSAAVGEPVLAQHGAGGEATRTPGALEGVAVARTLGREARGDQDGFGVQRIDQLQRGAVFAGQHGVRCVERLQGDGCFVGSAGVAGRFSGWRQLVVHAHAMPVQCGGVFEVTRTVGTE